MRRATIALLLAMLALVITQGCSESASDQEDLRNTMVAALDTLAAEFVEDRPADVSAYTERLQSYRRPTRHSLVAQPRYWTLPGP